ncbi:hypothetical protein C2G38_2181236 [Gigaspora rosea]|uniref:Uncharacterized protein n=1 Tax=Gigaspora rosea TaxID=44941 RepID=A0A397VEC5_9GLOM|nr:hypothetical protein C2G38_2181236 [Gigaspora rosea]
MIRRQGYDDGDETTWKRRLFSSEIITIVTLTGAVRFNICNYAKNMYTLEDLDNSLKIKQDLALKFRVKFNFIMGRYKDAIIDLTKSLPNKICTKISRRSLSSNRTM